jgi:hypothetical protein
VYCKGEFMSLELLIDIELEEYLPKVTSDLNNKILEEMLVESNGPLDSIKVWKETGEIIDGHRRYGICKRRNLPFEHKIDYLSFANKEDVKWWMSRYGYSRRNYNSAQSATEIARIYDGYKARGLSSGDAVKQTAEDTGQSARGVYRQLSVADALTKLPEDLRKRIEAGEIKAFNTDVVALAEMGETHRNITIKEWDSGDYKTIGDVIKPITAEKEEDDIPMGTTQPDGTCDSLSQPASKPKKPKKKKQKPAQPAEIVLIEDAKKKLAIFARATENLNQLCNNTRYYTQARAKVVDLDTIMNEWHKKLAKDK